ncbi:hypothetical protein ACFCY8_10595 [Streptomyces noursei]|uniref:hypothetical protein n=1 Tax=Streptomyces noursei TaxID=1971 RepID=UPI0035D6D10B
MDYTDDVRVAAGRQCADLEAAADRLVRIAKAIAAGVYEAADSLSGQDRAEAVEALYQEAGRKLAESIVKGGAIGP